MTDKRGSLDRLAEIADRVGARVDLTEDEANQLVNEEVRAAHQDRLQEMRERGVIGTDHETAQARRMQNPEYARVRAKLAPYEYLARTLITHRLRHNLSQQQLAELMGLSADHIARLESGRPDTVVGDD